MSNTSKAKNGQHENGQQEQGQKTEQELVKELQEGKSVKATDLASAMGIEVIRM